MQHATTAASTEKTDGPPAATPEERVTRKVLQDWGWAHQFDLRGVMSILDEIRGRRGDSPEMAKAAAEHQRYYEMVSSVLPTGEDGGEFGRETLSKLDSAHGHLMNLYEERGFRLGLAVAAAARGTDGIVEAVPAEDDGGEGLEASPWEETAPDDDDPEPEPSDEERRANRLGYAAEGLRQARQQAILLPDHQLAAYVAGAQRRLDELVAVRAGEEPGRPVEAPSAGQGTPPRRVYAPEGALAWGRGTADESERWFFDLEDLREARANGQPFRKVELVEIEGLGVGLESETIGGVTGTAELADVMHLAAQVKELRRRLSSTREMLDTVATAASAILGSVRDVGGDSSVTSTRQALDLFEDEVSTLGECPAPEVLDRARQGTRRLVERVNAVEERYRRRPPTQASDAQVQGWLRTLAGERERLDRLRGVVERALDRKHDVSAAS